jgi:hypothetical protein
LPAVWKIENLPLLMGTSPISWMSKKQTGVAMFIA